VITIEVNTSKPYNVLIGTNLLADVGKIVKKEVGFSKICIITDDVVDALYGEKTVSSFISEGFLVEKFVIEHGEKSKNAENLIRIVSFLAEKRFNRSDMIIALGGGVVGDLAGFCAATYMRGIKFIQVPTTLLAAVDSSVGGKTAVDLPQGKNLFGAFWQPSLVICDTETLDTLSDEIYADGAAEIIKYGMIYDEELFHIVKSGKWNRNEVIAKCVSIKRDVVNEDEFENGIRQILNFGHTFGHAVESLSGFKSTHGHCVAIGMAMITYALVQKGEVSKNVFDELIEALENNHLPTKCDFESEQIFNLVTADKKSSSNGVNLILVKKIGKAQIDKTDFKTVKELIYLGVKCGK